MHTFVNVRAGCVVMLHACACVTTSVNDDIALGDDFHLLPERGTRFERGTHDVFGGVTTVNIRLIEGRDSLIERFSNFGIDMFNRRIGIVCQAPHTVNELAELQPLSNLKTFHKFHLKLCSIVYALISAM